MNRDEFEALFRRIAPGLLRYLTYLVGRDDADDIVTETMITLWRKNLDAPTTTDDTDRLTGLAFRIAQGHARNHTRATNRRLRLLNRLGLGTRDEPTSPSAEAHLIVTDTSRALLAPLQPDDQLLIALVADDFTSNEIAAILGLSGAAVRMRLSRARNTLRPHIEATHE